MELVKKKIHTDQVSGRAGAQTVLEDDVNISDNKMDASDLLSSKGEILLEEVRPCENAVNLRGKLVVSVLYLTDTEGMCASMEAALPFEERVNMDGVSNSDAIQTQCSLEDLTVGLINSRKLSVQAVLNFSLEREEQAECEAGVDLIHDEPVEYRKCVYPVVELALHKKDIFRIKEEMELTGNLPNIFQTIWHHISFDHVEFKALEEKLAVQGEMRAFFLYEGEGDNDKTLWYENTVPFSGIIECHGCKESMIPDIQRRLGQCSVEVRQDFDGEERVFCIEAALDLDIRLYAEDSLETISDVYGVDQEIQALTTRMPMKSLLLSGSGKCKIAEHSRIQHPETPMYQIIHSEGEIRVSAQSVVENGIAVTGTLQVTTLYLGAGNGRPISATVNVLPFQYVIEAENITPACLYKLRGSIEQLTVTMLGGDELDVKATLQFKVIVFALESRELVTDIQAAPLDLNKLSELPGMAICVVGPKDTLWDIGKRYYVPVSQLKEVNELSSEEIKAGDKILVVKGGV